ncbi:MAG: putative O-glycosylation ligase, exosortase A system-associated [Pseudomonadota bacterium]
MRDVLILTVIVLSLLAAFRHPFAGILLWAWFSLMTPHLMAYGVYGIPLNAIIAAGTIASCFAHGEFQRVRITPISVLLVIFALLLYFSQLFSLAPEVSGEYFDRFFKTLIFIILISLTATTKLRVNALVWMLVISIGYFGAKGALFTLVTLGEYRVQGVTKAILEDNNHMGIALVSILPMILYLRGQSSVALVKHGLAVLVGLCVLAIIGTHSRGAFVSLVAFAGFLWLQSKHKIAITAALALMIPPAIAFMPSKWMDRMNSIQTATQDESFMGRVLSWQNNWELAKQNPFTGAGLRVAYEPDVVAREISPERADSAIAAHSIYFEILGGAGFLALAIYLSIFAVAFLTSTSLAREPVKGRFAALDHKAHPLWARRFGYFAQISLVAFGLGGASVSLEMWDGYWIIIALVAASAAIPGYKDKKETVGITPNHWRVNARMGSERMS